MTETKQKAGRLSREIWLAEGLRALVDSGLSELKVERMARRLKVTKGSFYWHFKDNNAYLNDIVDYWLDLQEDIVLNFKADPDSKPEQRLWDLLEFIRNKDSSTDVAIRAWARFNPYASKAVGQVDKTRLVYCQNLFTEMGFSKDESILRARMIYFYQVGEYTIGLSESKNRRLKLDKLRYEQLIRKK